MVIDLSAPPAIEVQQILFDQTEIKQWQIVNDTVMGGFSHSQFIYQNNSAIFKGTTSLENNGGFASTKRSNPLTLTNENVIKLIVKGDGRRYQFRLKTPALYRGMAYVAEFETISNEWQIHYFTLADFTAKYRGNIVQDTARLNFSELEHIGFLIADKVADDFQLIIKSISFLHQPK